MKMVYYCNKCGFIGSDEKRLFGGDAPNCPECNSKLVNINITRDEWISMTKEQKEEKKISLRNEAFRLGFAEDAAYQKRAFADKYMVTTGYNFEGYNITSYNGVLSSGMILSTEFLSELSTSKSDSFGSESSQFANELESAKNVVAKELIKKAIANGSNALIGLDYDYIPLGYNMIGVSVNGTSVTIEKAENDS